MNRDRLVRIICTVLLAASLPVYDATAQHHDHDKMMREAAEAAAAAAADDVVPEITPDFDAVKSAEDPKHTPKITAPDEVKAGEWFDVTVEVGAGSRHPSLVEHHVRWIGIYKDDVELARAYLHPVHSSPKVTFTIRLEQSTTLRAMEEPTHTAAWESSKKIEVRKP